MAAIKFRATSIVNGLWVDFSSCFSLLNCPENMERFGNVSRLQQQLYGAGF